MFVTLIFKINFLLQAIADVISYVIKNGAAVKRLFCPTAVPVIF